MKNKIVLLALITVVLSSCGLDNYDEPESKFSGKVHYKGESVGVRGTNSRVQLQLWQNGYDLKEEYIIVAVNQDGAYGGLLFNGDYELVSRNNNGPWENKQDTIKFTMKGSANVDYEVTPYFLVRNQKISLSGNVVTSTFSVDKITQTDAKIQYIRLFVGKSKFVDDFGDCHLQWANKADSNTGAGTISLELNDKAKAARYLYGRVGVKIEGVEELVYSTEVIKLR